MAEQYSGSSSASSTTRWIRVGGGRRDASRVPCEEGDGRSGQKSACRSGWQEGRSRERLFCSLLTPTTAPHHASFFFSLFFPLLSSPCGRTVHAHPAALQNRIYARVVLRVCVFEPCESPQSHLSLSLSLSASNFAGKGKVGIIHI